MLRQIGRSRALADVEPGLPDELPIEQLRQALTIPARLIAGIRADQWGRPTPCEHWTVRDLVAHLIEGHDLIAARLGGPSIPEPRTTRSRHAADADEALHSGYRDASETLLAALAHADALHRLVTVPLGQPAPAPMSAGPDLTVTIGPVSGAVVLHLRIVECLVHGWDLARATGQRSEFPEDLTEQALGFIVGRLIMHPEARAVFGPSRTAGAYAPAIDRLAACLGRDALRMDE